MTAESRAGHALSRRRLLALAALALPAACSTAPPTAVPVAATAVPTVPPIPFAPPSTSAAPSASRSAPAKPSAAPTTSAAEKAAASARGGPVPFRPGAAMMGSYLALGGMSLKQSLALRRKQLGREQRIVHVFYPWDGYVPRSEPDVAASSTLMVSWHGARYAGITNGSSDRTIASMAKKLKGMNRPILLRWGWEMNGDWFEWGGANNGRDAAGYAKAWKRMHRIFREQGADNVAWVWSPNWNSGPNESWNTMQRYYPGDEYVDWVGVSGYDFYSESPKTLFTPVVQAYGERKPIIFSETAAVEHGGRGKAEWVRKLAAYVKATPEIGAVVWFDTDTQDDTNHNFRPDTDGATLAAYRTMVRASRFSG